MLESNIHHGNQSIPADLGELKYGVSVTDACMDWEMTENALMEMADSLRSVLFDRA
jgi:3-deoxy-7-phosphoheptulonate synthase